MMPADAGPGTRSIRPGYPQYADTRWRPHGCGELPGRRRRAGMPKCYGRRRYLMPAPR